jgi:hypothetical protein
MHLGDQGRFLQEKVDASRRRVKADGSDPLALQLVLKLRG